MAGKSDAEALLETANSASVSVAGLHVAFMAVCVYVLVIVFGTTDVDLLMGKGVKLPVVNVDVPITGFYAFAPFIVLLAHFNLLLQLQLLSRKLFAFNAAAPAEEGIGGLRDRLHIFPYTYYLVGKPSPLARPLIGLMVSITLVLLPFATLLALQLRFLAYQSEAVTWAQRIAVWLDVAVLAVLWPVILHSKDDWKDYWRSIIAAHIRRKRVWFAYAFLFLGMILTSFSALDKELLVHGREAVVSFLAGFVLILLAPPMLVALSGWRSVSVRRKIYLSLLFASMVCALVASFQFDVQPELFLAVPWLLVPAALFWHPKAPRGSLALLLALYMGSFLTLALQVDGERLERMVARAQKLPRGSTLMSLLLDERRRLDLHEQVLFAKPASPETLALVRSGEWQKALQQVEPLNLRDRNLRHAVMTKAVLLNVNLASAQLQGADLGHALLQGANLSSAGIQGAYLGHAGLQGADLSSARLQGADLGFAGLQGADLGFAGLQGAELGAARLEGANLGFALLQGANLVSARLLGANLGHAGLEGANLQHAGLQGADLASAKLKGADLRGAKLYAAAMDRSTGTELVDARKTEWTPIGEYFSGPLIEDLEAVIKDKNMRRLALDRLRRASRPDIPGPEMESCLADPGAPFRCRERFDPRKPRDVEAFTGKLHPYLGRLACESPEIASGLFRQIPGTREAETARAGLEEEMKKGLEDAGCAGLQGLGEDKKKKLRGEE